MPQGSVNSAKTHCRNGHPYSEDNTILGGPKRTWRWCRTCSKKNDKEWRGRDPDHARQVDVEKSARYRRKSPEQWRQTWRESHYRKNYGITLEKVEAMIALQCGKCAACGDTEKLHVDHCHDSNKVRGMLCRKCNIALGMVNDDPARLQKLIDYLS